MLFRVVFPLVFVGLWSSAFVTAKVGVVYATPFAMLLTRFSIVSLLFLAMLMARAVFITLSLSVVLVEVSAVKFLGPK